MYCPKCSTFNSDESRFCRGCGQNLVVVSQALTGSLVPPVDSIEEQEQFSSGIKDFFVGVGFFMAAIFSVKWSRFWSVGLFIVAFATIGKSVSKLLGTQQGRALLKTGWTGLLNAGKPAPPQQVQPPMQAPMHIPPYYTGPLPPPTPLTGELPPPGYPQPPSVTESTTRNLDPRNPQQRQPY